MNIQARTRHARLPAAFKNAADHAGYRGVLIGIIEHDVRRLAAQLQRHGHQLFGGGVGNGPAAGGAARERHHAHAGMFDQAAAHRGPQARDHVENAGRQARFQGDAAQSQRGRGRHFGRLEDDGVAGRQRGGHLLRFHRQR
ncbi:hypothetical protein D3C72_1714850 [compost metagenome]